MGGGPGLWAKLQGNRPPSLLAPRLLPPLPDSSFLSGVRLGPREVMPASFCKSTGPWLYGDSEAHTEYVQNDFFTSKVERHPFDKGPFGEGYRGKLRVSFVPKAAAGSWRRAWNTTEREGRGLLLHSLPRPSTSSSPLYLRVHKLGLLLFLPRSQKADSPHHPTLRLVPTKWMKTLFRLTPGHENSEALLKRTL